MITYNSPLMPDMRNGAPLKILVTGAAGFIGSNLCNRLVILGFEVIGIDNLYSGNIENLEPIKSNERFTFLKQDVMDPLDFEVDMIFNLACPASPIWYQKDPIGTFKSSVLGTLNVLELAVRTKARVLQASTSEIYGDPFEHPQPESYWGNVNPVGMRSCYDEGKRAAETLMFDFQRIHGLSIRVARIFNTFGPNMRLDDGRVVPNFIGSALLNKPIEIYGDGSQTRCFCYIDDLIEALLRLMFLERDPLSPVNLGNPQETTMVEFAKLIIQLTGSSSEVVFRELPSDDPKQRKPNINLANQLLNWEPKWNYEAGLVKTIEQIRQRITNNSAYGEIAL